MQRRQWERLVPRKRNLGSGFRGRVGAGSGRQVGQGPSAVGVDFGRETREVFVAVVIV